MVLPRVVFALALVSGCAASRAAPPPPPPQSALQPPAEVDEIVAARLPVAYYDVPALARVLHDILDVRPDRGDVRAILHNQREATLVVFATPAGHASVRHLLAGLLTPTSS